MALKQFLENRDILKVGVGIETDATKLLSGYGFRLGPFLDLRQMAKKAELQSGSLAKMSKELLNIELDKNLTVICSNWEAETLTREQIDYAARDAMVGSELFHEIWKLTLPYKTYARYFGKY